jgi:signal peptidase I
MNGDGEASSVMNLVSSLRSLVFSIPVAGTLIRGRLSIPAHVVGGSMYPLLNNGDRTLVDRAAYRGSIPRRGDVVLFARAYEGGERMIKLVGGLPGETIEVHDDHLWVDGRRLQFPSPMVGSLPGSWKLGPDEWFALSFAVAVGTDSRAFGAVPLAAVLGQVWYVLAPSPRAGPIKAPALLQDERSRETNEA